MLGPRGSVGRDKDQEGHQVDTSTLPCWLVWKHAREKPDLENKSDKSEPMQPTRLHMPSQHA